MNNYDKYINDDLLSRVFKNRLEEEDKKELFDIDYNPKTVYYTCAANETEFNKKDSEEAIKLLNKLIEERRQLILEFFLKYNDTIFDTILNQYVGKTEQLEKPVFKLYPPYFSI